MKRTLLLAFVLLAILATSAFAAGGLNINWGSGCWSDGTPLNDKTFACSANTGADAITCSFQVSADQPGFVGIELKMQGASEAASVPQWWQMDTGECRGTAISASEDFTSAPGVTCVDPWANQALGGLAGYFDGVTTPDPLPGSGPNNAYIIIGFALNADTPSPLTAGTEYYAARITVTHAKTVGTGACDGCSVPMIWGFYSMKAAELGSFEMLFEPLPGGNQCLTWQSSTLACGLVPARNTTWGQVKSLYR